LNLTSVEPLFYSKLYHCELTNFLTKESILQKEKKG